MADQGFIINDAEVTAIGSAYAVGKVVTLHEDTPATDLSKAMPQGCYLSHLELQLDETTPTSATVSCFLTWDSTGDDPLTAEATAVSLHDGLTDTSLRNTSVAMDVWVRAPAGQTASGKCYLFLKVNAGAVTLKKARLHWVARQY